MTMLAGKGRIPRPIARKKSTNNKPLDSIRRKLGLKKFKRAAQVIIIGRYLSKVGPSTKLTNQESILFFLDIPTANQGKDSQGDKDQSDTQSHQTPFDVNAFKGVREALREEPQGIAAVARKLLEQPAASRSEAEVKQLVQTMQTYSKFTGYPNHVQNGICKHGWYAKFNASRVLVRRNKPAELYYFLLSGVAISRTMDKCEDPNESRRRQRAIFLRKGDIIGEKELLQNIKREATVVTKETVEVLGLDKNDFLNIFKMVMGDKLDFLPYLKSIEELLFFPLELLQSHYSACSLQNFKRGTIMTRNSNDADWIFIIKKGSCDVLKAVRRRSRIDLKPGTRSSSEASNFDHILPPNHLPAIGVAGRETQTQRPQINAKRRESVPGSRQPVRSQSDSYLPRVGGRNLVGRPARIMSDGGTPSSYSDDESSNHKPRSQNRRRSSLFHERSSTDGEHQKKSPDTEHKQYAILHSVTPGSIFGLHSLIYEDSPALTLVSQGCECVMIAKQFLRDHMDSTTLNKLRIKMPPYPSMSQVQESLEDRAKWESYKNRVINHLIKP